MITSFNLKCEVWFCTTLNFICNFTPVMVGSVIDEIKLSDRSTKWVNPSEQSPLSNI